MVFGQIPRYAQKGCPAVAGHPSGNRTSVLAARRRELRLDEVHDGGVRQRGHVPELAVLGDIAGLPAELDALRARGIIESVAVEVRAVLIRVCEDVTWPAVGAEIRTALAAALLSPHAWMPADGISTIGEDDALRAALEDVLAGPAGDYVRSHGGEVTIESVCGGRAQVHMRGTCSHCPAAGWTLHLRLEAELRRRYPTLVELTAAGAGRRG